jgi:hypothetical protein
MRLSPKSIFFGLVAFGLPISIGIGWTLATQPRRPASIGAPAGTGGMGAGELGSAPDRPAHRPDTVVQFSPQPSAPAPPLLPSSAVAPVGSAPVASSPVTSAPAPPVSEPPLPSLTQPPVPTPTEITDPPTASPPESETPTAAPSGAP